ncbi:MAG: hypothetical protein JJ992_03135 [Planctomycetes bacterium]|nr:hypothetical protein [Planctomycetota bacterium]
MMLLGFLALGLAAFAGSEVRVESTRPVASPRGDLSIIVDRFATVIDGEPERYPGVMEIRIVNSDGKVVNRRRVTSPQVRLIQKPVWLDSQWCGFSYNIAKNSYGMVYYDSLADRAVQLEMVAPSRRMGATGKIETELTSLEITDYAPDGSTESIQNIPHNGGSVFPLYLKPLPTYDDQPFGLDFLQEIRNSIEAEQKMIESRGITTLRVEQASESFAPADSLMSVLVLTDRKPNLLIMPLKAESATAAFKQAKLIPLGEDVLLRCANEYAEPDSAGKSTGAPEPADSDSDTTEPLQPLVGYRFTTAWQDDSHVEVVLETFETEEEVHRDVIYTIGMDGTVSHTPRKPRPRPAVPEEGAPDMSSSDAGTTDSVTGKPESEKPGTTRASIPSVRNAAARSDPAAAGANAGLAISRRSDNSGRTASGMNPPASTRPTPSE